MDTQDGDWRDRSSAWDNYAGGLSPVRVALLFGLMAVAVAMIAVPVLQNGARNLSFAGEGAGIDTMPTASIRNGDKHYTIRRSVLQPSPNAICIVRPNGTRSGAC